MVNKKDLALSLTHKDLARVRKRWPWASNSVSEVNVVNLLQMLTPAERIHFANELYRVLKRGAKAQISAPHWCSARAYGDLTFQWPPVSETWPHHLNAEWRKANAPWGTKYKCDFDIGGGYGMHPQIVTRNQEYQQHAVAFFKEAAQDLIISLTKR
jgi:predicted SAM-dependent methyltransferase